MNEENYKTVKKQFEAWGNEETAKIILSGIGCLLSRAQNLFGMHPIEFTNYFVEYLNGREASYKKNQVFSFQLFMAFSNVPRENKFECLRIFLKRSDSYSTSSAVRAILNSIRIPCLVWKDVFDEHVSLLECVKIDETSSELKSISLNFSCLSDVVLVVLAMKFAFPKEILLWSDGVLDEYERRMDLNEISKIRKFILGLSFRDNEMKKDLYKRFGIVEDLFFKLKLEIESVENVCQTLNVYNYFEETIPNLTMMKMLGSEEMMEAVENLERIAAKEKIKCVIVILQDIVIQHTFLLQRRLL